MKAALPIVVELEGQGSHSRLGTLTGQWLYLGGPFIWEMWFPSFTASAVPSAAPVQPGVGVRGGTEDLNHGGVFTFHLALC